MEYEAWDTRKGEMSKGPEIKPCPFCGEKPEAKNWNTMNGYYEPIGRSVQCLSKLCKINPEVYKKTQQEAIKAWNTRYEE